MIFTPNYFQKYTAEIIDVKHNIDFDQTYYYDLNGDGISEKIQIGYNQVKKNIRIQHYNLEGKVYDQWMPRGNWLVYPKPIFGDYNNNGYAEIYCLSIDADSIFLSVKELMLENGLEIKNRFICKAGTFDNNENDVVDWGGKLMDINDDDFDEYVFFIHAGFSKFPRNTIAYYIINDSVAMSPLSASAFDIRLQFMDLNGDGVEEITGLIGSSENIHYEIPYTDSATWLMVIDPRTMNFHFPPLRFDVGIGSWIKPIFYNINDQKYIASTIYSNSAEKGINYIQLKLFAGNGKLIKEKNINKSEISRIVFINPENDKNNTYYLMDDFGNIYTTDTSLRLSLYYEPDFDNIGSSLHTYTLLDINDDGKNEVLVMAGNKKNSQKYLTIYSDKLEDALAIELPESKTYNNYHTSIINDGTADSPILLLQVGNYAYKIVYRKNPYYLFKYPAYTIVYVLLFVIFWLLQHIQNKYAQRKFKEEKKLIQQQMALSKKQLEPHFMLNTLNSIGHMFYQENKDDAQYYFGRFASLIHRSLKYANKTETTLREELEFIRDYLVLQQRRYDNLEYIITADEAIDLDSIFIPHSLVYTS